METNPTRMCELLVGLPEVTVLGVFARARQPVRVHVRKRRERPGCPACGVLAQVKDHHDVELVDLACFGRPARLVWKKVRWCCRDPDCAMTSWTEEDPGSPRRVWS